MLSFTKDAKKKILRNRQPSERANKYLQTKYKASAISTTGSLEHLHTSGDGKFHVFPFFMILQENKSLRKSYEDYFICKFKPLLNKKTQVAKSPKVAVFNMMSTSYSIPRQHQISKTKW